MVQYYDERCCTIYKDHGFDLAQLPEIDDLYIFNN